MIWNMQSRRALWMVLGLGLSAAEAEQAPQTAAPDSTEAGAVQRVVLAQDLLATAMNARDPLSALAAAGLLQSVSPGPAAGLARLAQDGPEAMATTAAPALLLPDAASVVLAKARDLAQGDDLTLEWIDREAAEGDAVPKLTLGYLVAVLAPGETGLWEAPFFGAARGEIGLVADGTGILTMRVLDSRDDTICLATGIVTSGYCTFIPMENGLFRAEVTNIGGEPAAFAVMTN